MNSGRWWRRFIRLERLRAGFEGVETGVGYLSAGVSPTYAVDNEGGQYPYSIW